MVVVLVLLMLFVLFLFFVQRFWTSGAKYAQIWIRIVDRIISAKKETDVTETERDTARVRQKETDTQTERDTDST